MTAAWKLVSQSPWNERGRNPAFPLALAAHLAVLLAFGIGSFLRVTPVPPGDLPELRPVLVTILEPPPIEPVLEPEPPPFEVVIPRGDTPTVPALPREELTTEAPLPDVAGPPRDLTAFGESSFTGPVTDLFGERDPGGPGGTPDGRGTRIGIPDGDPDAPPIPFDARMTRPVLLHKVSPEYPHTARIVRLPGHVVVRAVIARDGSVEEVEIESASSPLFERAAMEAVRQWRYRPALLQGRPVRVVFHVNVEFVLD